MPERRVSAAAPFFHSTRRLPSPAGSPHLEVVKLLELRGADAGVLRVPGLLEGPRPAGRRRCSVPRPRVPERCDSASAPVEGDGEPLLEVLLLLHPLLHGLLGGLGLGRLLCTKKNIKQCQTEKLRKKRRVSGQRARTLLSRRRHFEPKGRGGRALGGLRPRVRATLGSRGGKKSVRVRWGRGWAGSLERLRERRARSKARPVAQL